MKPEKLDLTTGPLGKQILCFSLPLILSNLLQVLFNLADIAVVGRFVGSMALGSVGSTSTLVTMLTGFLIGLGGGINVLVARHFGARDRESMQQTIHSAVLISTMAGIGIMVFGLICSRGILQLLNTKPELLDGAVLYLRIYFLGMPALALYNFGNAVFSAVGNTRKPLIYLSIAGVLNVALNLFFVLICKMEVAGVATASAISQYFSAALVIWALFRSQGPYSLHLSSLHLSRSKSLEILRFGIPSGIQNAIFQIANMFIQGGVNTFSATIVSGNAAAANADFIVYDVMAAFYTACSSFMGQNYGAIKRERMRKSYFISLAYSFGAGVILGALLVLFGEHFLALFTKDSAVVEAGMLRLTIMGFSYGFSAFMDCTIAASRALGKSLVPTMIVIMGSCVFRIIWVNTVFAHFQTIPSLYLLYIFSWGITSIAEILYFIKVYRAESRRMKPLVLQAP